MTVRERGQNVIVLEGECPVEAAEGLLERLQQMPGAVVDWTACTRLHTALVQIVLAARPPLVGPCGDAFVERWIASSIPARDIAAPPDVGG